MDRDTATRWSVTDQSVCPGQLGQRGFLAPCTDAPQAHRQAALHAALPGFAFPGLAPTTNKARFLCTYHNGIPTLNRALPPLARRMAGRSSSHSKICAVAASHRALVRSSPLVRTVLLNATQVSLLVLVLRLPQQSVAFTLPAANEPHSERFVGAPPPIHASHLQ